eukprot:TRINITY_DN1787_c0_g1_i1.p1 TRINITY_DN1787_c0_g1~~TRINITY_DN1787_c0_g1_i1.p1  ORF type:complete len:498 (+),score=78.51 TRINITY_DN1787_c0_g1_i1:123-1616(+)
MFSTPMTQYVVMLLAVFVLAPAVVHSQYARSPGVKVTITETGLTYIKDISMPYLFAALETTAIPDQSADGSGFTVDLTNFQIVSMNVGTSDINITATGFDAIAGGVTGSITVDWHYRQNSWPHVSDSGSASISLSNSMVTATVVTFINDSIGEAQMNVTVCECSIQDIDIDLHGGASWFYQIFVNLFRNKITDAINSAIPPALTSAIQSKGDASLATAPTVETVTPNVEIDYAFVNDVVYTAGKAFTTSHWGEFYCISDKVEANHSIPTLPETSPDDSMLQVYVSDFTAFSAGLAYLGAGNLSVSVTPGMVPNWFPVQLNTTDFKIAIPALYNAYPNQAMGLNINATSPPDVAFSPSGILIDAVGDIAVFVIDSTGTWTPTFTLNVSAHFNGSAHVVGTSLGGTIGLLDASFDTASSSIGPIESASVTSFVNLVLTDFIVPVVNTILKPGFPLPTIDGLSFVDPVIYYETGYIWVGTDIAFNATDGPPLPGPTTLSQ